MDAKVNGRRDPTIVNIIAAVLLPGSSRNVHSFCRNVMFFSPYPNIFFAHAIASFCSCSSVADTSPSPPPPRTRDARSHPAAQTAPPLTRVFQRRPASLTTTTFTRCNWCNQRARDCVEPTNARHCRATRAHACVRPQLKKPFKRSE